MKRGLVSVAFLALLAVTLGCSIGEALQDPGDPVDMTTATIAGTWHAGTARFITFNEDGTFTALNLPHELFEDYPTSPDPAAPPIDAAGRYTLNRGSNATDGPHADVKLAIDEHTKADEHLGSVTMNALRPGDGQVYLVFFYSGSGGNSWTGYLKCAADCFPPRPYGTTS
ncbi:hypothetical protein AB0M46_37730 [Dactylosporangium sp. NPDC051485]|uniref:hypothetical protein n=1 Tax=Dactylosporangium sp. NPDC051485 TaxID=3154846 RepID=UPI003414981A